VARCVRVALPYPVYCSVRFFPHLVALLAFIAAITAPVSAASVRTSDRGLYAMADVVVHGIVISAEVQTLPNGSPQTVSVIEPLEVLKGGLPGSLIIREEGAIASDGTGFDLASPPDFVPGREVVVFALSRPQGDFQTMFGRSGKFEVWKDQSGAPFAVSDRWRVAGTGSAERTVEGLRDLARFISLLRNGSDRSTDIGNPSGELDPVNHDIVDRQLNGNTRVVASNAADSTNAAGLTVANNPLYVCDGTGLGSTTVSWDFPGVSPVDIRVNSPNGTLFARGGSSGSAVTPKWVRDRMIFYALNNRTGAILGSVTMSVVCAQSFVRLTNNPVQVCDGTGKGIATVEWSYPGVPVVDIQVTSARILFTRGGSRGAVTTAKWVTNGMVFYAVNNATGATLGSVTATVTTNCAAPAPPPPTAEPTPAPGATYPPAQIITSQPTRLITARPPYRQTAIVPGLSTSIMRISDALTFGAGRRVYRHFYSKRQPWNSDGTRILLAHENTAYLLDGKSFAFIKAFTPWSEPVWSNTNPDILYGVASNPGGLIEYRVSTNSYRVLQAFPEFSQTFLGIGEGNLSNDDRYVAMVGQTVTGADVLVYDIPNRRIVSRKSFPGPIAFGVDIDWVSMSPSGRYVIVAHNNATNRGHDIYDAQTMAFLRRLTPAPLAHADIGYDTSGNEVLVTQSGSTAISSIRLADGYVRQELSTNHMAANQHISCRNTARRGYCYVSTYPDVWGFDKYLYREIFALKLDGSGTIERFSQGFSAALPLADLQYSRQPHAVPNRDGSLVMFASDWSNATPTAIIDAYVVGVRIPQ
jgi:hypothetical protein